MQIKLVLMAFHCFQLAFQTFQRHHFIQFTHQMIRLENVFFGHDLTYIRLDSQWPGENLAKMLNDICKCWISSFLPYLINYQHTSKTCQNCLSWLVPVKLISGLKPNRFHQNQVMKCRNHSRLSQISLLFRANLATICHSLSAQWKNLKLMFSL